MRIANMKAQRDCTGKIKERKILHMEEMKAMTMEIQQEFHETETTENWFDVLEQDGLHLSEKQKQDINEKINRVLSYEPMIGLF